MTAFARCDCWARWPQMAKTAVMGRQAVRTPVGTPCPIGALGASSSRTRHVLLFEQHHWWRAGCPNSDGTSAHSTGATGYELGWLARLEVHR
jgi:hypothetical protein